MTFNLNGNNWVNSDSMGKQLLMKAGWSKGEGIGKNKQGTNVHIKVSIKNEKDGIGFRTQKRQNDLSLMQSFTFDNILKSKYGKKNSEIKNSEEVDEINQRGLSRARFGRAVPKDFFKPVESEEMNKILCKSKSDRKEENIKEISIRESDFDNRNSNFTSPFSVFQYFSMKMKNSKIKIKNFSEYLNEKNVEKEIKSDSKKRKTEKEEDSCEEVEKKRSKMTKSISELPDENVEIISTNVVEKKKKIENSSKISENFTKKAKKSKKQNKEGKNKETIESDSPTICDKENTKIKSKKKSKSKNCDETPPVQKEEGKTSSKKNKRKLQLDLVDNSVKIAEVESLPDKKKKKSKKRRIESKNEEESPISDEEASVSKKTNKSVASVEIIDKKSSFCPWDSCNISAIEGYKYY